MLGGRQVVSLAPITAVMFGCIANTEQSIAESDLIETANETRAHLLFEEPDLRKGMSYPNVVKLLDDYGWVEPEPSIRIVGIQGPERCPIKGPVIYREKLPMSRPPILTSLSARFEYQCHESGFVIDNFESAKLVAIDVTGKEK